MLCLTWATERNWCVRYCPTKQVAVTYRRRSYMYWSTNSITSLTLGDGFRNPVGKHIDMTANSKSSKLILSIGSIRQNFSIWNDEGMLFEKEMKNSILCSHFKLWKSLSLPQISVLWIIFAIRKWLFMFSDSLCCSILWIIFANRKWLLMLSDSLYCSIKIFINHDKLT